ncbi:MAG: DUF411 domain-containing protein [Burkholderiales bacterium]|nr:MAG: DUF411 domain-containing protein [Burkholderiales bacterium]
MLAAIATGLAAGFSAGFSALAHAATPARRPPVEVWKDPSCGCCRDWVAYLEREGFQVVVHDVGNTAARRRLGMPARLGSCHTATVDGYVIEGHVPVEDIRSLLDERPAGVLGLAVPGMPVGSPGMDGAIYGGRRDPYDVLRVARDGRVDVYRSVR